MIGYLKRLTMRNLVSPYGLALVSYCVFLVAWAFPPDVYMTYISEPDLMYHDPLTFVFYTSCVIAFMLGIRACGSFGISPKPVPLTAISTRKPMLYFALPLILSTVSCCVLLYLLGGKISLVGVIVEQQGAMMKTAQKAGQLEVGGKWQLSLDILRCTLWWCAYRFSQIKLRKIEKVVLYSLFLMGLFVELITSIATVDRTHLMSVLAGLLIIYFYNRSNSRKSSFRSLAVTVIASFGAIIALFSFLSFLRGSSAVTSLVRSLMGYSIVSYNRLAAVLHGLLHYTYAGKYIYLSFYLSEHSVLSDALNLQRFFGTATTQDVWLSEFTSVASAGLMPGFIWSGAFGYIYSDLGWWTLLFLFLTGLMGGYLWAGFKAGRTISVLVYLWFAFSILFWLGSNIVFDGKIVTTLECGILLALYDRAFIRHIRE